MEQIYFYFDQSRCIGCNTCVVACKDWNDTKPGVKSYRTIKTIESGSFQKGTTKVNNLVYSCNHCANPSCIPACPAAAIFKTKDGTVQVDEAKCIGIGECIDACPYNAIHLEETTHGKIAHKCTLCWERLAVDMEPICIASCPQRALDYGPKNKLLFLYPDAIEPIKEVSSEVNSLIEGFPIDNISNNGSKLDIRTKPSILIKSNK